MARKVTAREIVVGMLEVWGEWELLGLYQAEAGSALGKLIKGGGAPRGGFGPGLPRALLIPTDVMTAGRLVARMRDEAKAGERYYKLIRARFVAFPPSQENERATNRAIAWIVAAWVQDRAQASLGHDQVKKVLQSVRDGGNVAHNAIAPSGETENGVFYGQQKRIGESLQWEPLRLKVAEGS